MYTAFALATLGFVVFAMTQRVDLVRADYYEEAMRHDSMQVARARAAQQGSIVRQQNDTLQLLSSEVALHESPVTIEWLRAQNPALDEGMQTSYSKLVIQGVSTEHLERGKWTLRVHWKVGQVPYQIDTTVNL